MEVVSETRQDRTFLGEEIHYILTLISLQAELLNFAEKSWTSPFSLGLSFLICNMDDFFLISLTPSCICQGLGTDMSNSFFHVTNTIWETSIGCECCEYSSQQNRQNLLSSLWLQSRVWSGETKYWYVICQLVISPRKKQSREGQNRGLG